MNVRATYNPTAFFGITFLITWSSWFLSAYFSYQEAMGNVQALFMIPGLFAPLTAAMIMIYRAKSPELWREYRDRLLNFNRLRPAMVPIMLFLMPAAILASIAVSLLFGKSADQFAIVRQFGFSAGPVPVLLLLIFVPALEEMGWRGYGVDSLRSRFNLFNTSLLFGLLWALWHLPMFFINHYYHNELLSNWVYTANFWVSIFPTAIIINWLYYRNNRSVIACFLFHLTVDLACEMFQVEQFTKCISTVILILIAAWIVIAERKLFFEENPIDHQMASQLTK